MKRKYNDDSSYQTEHKHNFFQNNIYHIFAWSCETKDVNLLKEIVSRYNFSITTKVASLVKSLLRDRSYDYDNCNVPMKIVKIKEFIISCDKFRPIVESNLIVIMSVIRLNNNLLLFNTLMKHQFITPANCNGILKSFLNQSFTVTINYEIIEAIIKFISEANILLDQQNKHKIISSGSLWCKLLEKYNYKICIQEYLWSCPDNFDSEKATHLLSMNDTKHDTKDDPKCLSCYYFNTVLSCDDETSGQKLLDPNVLLFLVDNDLMKVTRCLNHLVIKHYPSDLQYPEIRHTIRTVARILDKTKNIYVKALPKESKNIYTRRTAGFLLGMTLLDRRLKKELPILFADLLTTDFGVPKVLCNEIIDFL